MSDFYVEITGTFKGKKGIRVINRNTNKATVLLNSKTSPYHNITTYNETYNYMVAYEDAFIGKPSSILRINKADTKYTLEIVDTPYTIEGTIFYKDIVLYGFTRNDANIYQKEHHYIDIDGKDPYDKAFSTISQMVDGYAVNIDMEGNVVLLTYDGHIELLAEIPKSFDYTIEYSYVPNTNLWNIYSNDHKNRVSYTYDAKTRKTTKLPRFGQVKEYVTHIGITTDQSISDSNLNIIINDDGQILYKKPVEYTSDLKGLNYSDYLYLHDGCIGHPGVILNVRNSKSSTQYTTLDGKVKTYPVIRLSHNEIIHDILICENNIINVRTNKELFNDFQNALLILNKESDELYLDIDNQFYIIRNGDAYPITPKYRNPISQYIYHNVLVRNTYQRMDMPIELDGMFIHSEIAAYNEYKHILHIT